MKNWHWKNICVKIYTLEFGYFVTPGPVCVFRITASENDHLIMWHSVRGVGNAFCFPTALDRANSKYKN